MQCISISFKVTHPSNASLYSIFPGIHDDEVLGFGFESDILEEFCDVVSTIAFIILNLTCAILYVH